MNEYVDSRLSKSLRRTAIAIAAIGSIAAQAASARATNNIVVVHPSELPELSRQAGDALFLHETIDGKTLLYIEQNLGGRLVVLDVTDPAHVTGEGSVKLDARGPFDFVSELGERKELVHFRQSQKDADKKVREMQMSLDRAGRERERLTGERLTLKAELKTAFAVREQLEVRLRAVASTGAKSARARRSRKKARSATNASIS